MKRILITGGIGSGKTIVSKIIHVLGFPVYNCDLNARKLMDYDNDLKRELKAEFSDCYTLEGYLNREKLANLVFNSPSMLNRLNCLVHCAVRADLRRWFSQMEKSCTAAFVETAIPVTSQILEMTDIVWEVEAPLELKESRVKGKRGISSDDFRKRVEAQKHEFNNLNGFKIVNDDRHAILPQVELLLQRIR